VVIAILAACTGGGECDTGACDTTTISAFITDEARVERVDWGCCAADDADCDLGGGFWYDVVVRGRVRGATLDIFDATAEAGRVWREQHALPVYVADPDGFWEDRYVELATPRGACEPLWSCEDHYRPGVSTLFPCTARYTEERMTWVLRTYTTASGPALECWAWGARSGTIDGCEARDPN